MLRNLWGSSATHSPLRWSRRNTSTDNQAVVRGSGPASQSWQPSCRSAGAVVSACSNGSSSLGQTSRPPRLRFVKDGTELTICVIALAVFCGLSDTERVWRRARRFHCDEGRSP